MENLPCHVGVVREQDIIDASVVMDWTQVGEKRVIDNHGGHHFMARAARQVELFANLTCLALSTFYNIQQGTQFNVGGAWRRTILASSHYAALNRAHRCPLTNRSALPAAKIYQTRIVKKRKIFSCFDKGVLSCSSSTAVGGHEQTDEHIFLLEQIGMC